VAGEADQDPGRNTLTQLSENLQRSNLKLLDVAQALQRCLDETGLTQAQLAKEELGESKSWVSKYLALLKAKGALQDALAEGYLGNPETARMFGRLDQAQQEKLLRRARKEDAPVSHAEVARLDKRQKAEASRSKAEPVAGVGDVENDSPAGTRRPEEHVVRLTSGQLRQLIELLGGTPGKEEFLIESLLTLWEQTDLTAGTRGCHRSPVFPPIRTQPIARQRFLAGWPCKVAAHRGASARPRAA
jgi:ParB-like chromosome segregation protein Spo0J